MLGAAQTAAWSSWWNQGFPAEIDFAGQATLTISAAQTPFYVVDYSTLNSNSLPGPTANASYFGNTIDTTTVANVSRNQTMSVTFRAASGSFSNDTYGLSIFFLWDDGATQTPQSWRMIRADAGNMACQPFNGADAPFDLGVSGDILNSGEWLTMVISGADDPANAFANWSGASVGSGEQAGRCRLIYTETGETIAQMDFVAPENPALGIIDLATPTLLGSADGNTSLQGWTYGAGFDPFQSAGFDQQLAGYWVQFGDAIDPWAANAAPLYSATPPEYVGNTWAWFRWRARDSLSSGNIANAAFTTLSCRVPIHEAFLTAGAGDDAQLITGNIIIKDV